MILRLFFLLALAHSATAQDTALNATAPLPPDGPPPLPPPPPHSLTHPSGGNSTELQESLNLPSFTYEGTEDDIKEAAYRYGLQIRNEDENKLVLPTMDIEAMILTDRAKNWQTYRYNPYYAQQKRYELVRELEKRLRASRTEHRVKMVKVCYNRCNAYINETFERPDLSAAATNASLLLGQLEMDDFPAKYLTMPLDEMKRITAENCEQWEADYQCIFGCTNDAALIDRMRAGLAGDYHLTANVECPNPDFAKFLPCVGEKTSEWVDPCIDFLRGYQQVKAQANQKIMVLEQQLASKPARSYYNQFYNPKISDVRQMSKEQSNMCGAYGDLLYCALPRLKNVCSERAASFVHTSLSENFASKVLLGKDAVKEELGSLSTVCLKLADKSVFRIFPIKK